MMAKPKGLGRGLDALLGGDLESPTERERLLELPLSALQPGKYQPRSQMDPAAIAELAESIRAQGMIQPILARAMGSERYEIIAGERRWRAAQQAGLKEVPVIVRDVPDQAALAMALIENIQREDLNAVEEASGLQRLITDFGLSHQEVATAVGRSRSAVTNLLRLLQLPQAIQRMMADGVLEMGHGRALIPLVQTERQLELAHAVATHGLSVRETERLVAKSLSGAQRAKADNRGDPDVRRLEDELSDSLGGRVEVRMRSKKAGKLLLHFDSLEHLDTLLARLRPS